MKPDRMFGSGGRGSDVLTEGAAQRRPRLRVNREIVATLHREPTFLPIDTDAVPGDQDVVEGQPADPGKWQGGQVQPVVASPRVEAEERSQQEEWCRRRLGLR